MSNEHVDDNAMKVECHVAVAYWDRVHIREDAMDVGGRACYNLLDWLHCKDGRYTNL